MASHQRLGVLQDNVSVASLHVTSFVICLHFLIYQFLHMELSLFNSLCYVVIRERILQLCWSMGGGFLWYTLVTSCIYRRCIQQATEPMCKLVEVAKKML